jgi:H+/Cl- antiporter ClcA
LLRLLVDSALSFGVPVAGAVFALEVQRVGRIRYEALVPAFVASFVGDAVVRGLGVSHTHYPAMPKIAWTVSMAWKVILFGVIGGLIAMLFVHLTRFIKGRFEEICRVVPSASCDWRCRSRPPHSFFRLA